MKTIRLYFYCLFYFYLVLVLLIMVLLGLGYFNLSSSKINLIIINTFIFLELFFGIYQYKVISKSYLNIDINRRLFFCSGLIYAFGQAVILTLIYFGINYFYQEVYHLTLINNISYLYIGLILLGISLIGNFIGIYFKKLQLLEFIFIVGLTYLFINYKIYLPKIENFYIEILNNHYLIQFIFIALGTFIFFTLINYLKFYKN